MMSTNDLPNWFDARYLTQGSRRQRDAHACLVHSQVLTLLAGFDPVLVGTIPLGIDIPSSDLDILCQVEDQLEFRTILTDSFKQKARFRLRHRHKSGLATIVCSFHEGTFELEIFGQARPVCCQNGYRHMVVEARLLRLAGPEAAVAIRHRKCSGLKTEPAFADYFNLAGDPYLALLDLYDADDEELKQLIAEIPDANQGAI